MSVTWIQSNYKKCEKYREAHGQLVSTNRLCHINYTLWNIFLLFLFLANSCSSFKLMKWPLQMIISPPLCSHSFNINLYCACIIPLDNYLSVYLIPIQKTRIIPFLSVTPHFPAPCQAPVNSQYILEILMNKWTNQDGPYKDFPRETEKQRILTFSWVLSRALSY